MSKVLIKESWNKRETVSFTDEMAANLVDDELEGWEVEESETTNINLQKGYQEVEFVAKRQSDGKYFVLELSIGDDYSVSELNKFPLEAKEVFPTTIKIVIYE